MLCISLSHAAAMTIQMVTERLNRCLSADRAPAGMFSWSGHRRHVEVRTAVGYCGVLGMLWGLRDAVGTWGC